jgi:predicted MFS family arabinose efflux permease
MQIYSNGRNPWYCLLLETCEAVTVHLMGVASSMFCASAAPPGTLATLNGAVGSFHYSFGRGLGSFVGGILISQYGTRTTFQVDFFGISLEQIIRLNEKC